METVILRCSCEHEYQDRVYGKGARVHNAMKKKSGKITYRCTVCGAEREGWE